ncbi:hypothetical protein K0U27_00230 [archaeon]|nr:hypothetical protein [archaeon]
MENQDRKNLQYAEISSKNNIASYSNVNRLQISPKGTTILGHHLECGETVVLD